MPKSSDLQEVLQSIDPILSAHTFVYVAVANQSLLKVLGYDPIAFYKEKSGITLVLRKEEADNNFLEYGQEYSMIDLNASNLQDCTGLVAILSSALAKAGIPLRPIQTAYSRILFVHKEDAYTAIEILASLQKRVQSLSAH